MDCNLRGIFAYTPAVRSAVFDIRGLIQAAIDYTNLAYDNSLIDFHLEAAFVYETDYVETGNDVAICWLDGLPYPDQSEDLCRFHHVGDGWMDEVHDYRDQYKADVCILFVDSLVPGKGGESFLPPVINAGEAFAIVLFNNTIETTAHEIGHIQGCHHDYNADPTWTNNHGYVHIGSTVDESFKTVMAYNNQCNNNFGQGCRTIPYFSHPEIFFEGVPIGETDPLGIDGAMNAINIMNQKALVNGFRDYPAIHSLPSTTIPSETFAYSIASTEIGNLNTYVIEDSSDVYFKSEDYITLRPGFQSQVGAFFEGRIGSECDPPFVQPLDICDEYGYSVDVHGDFAVVGDPLDNRWGPKAGAVYLYEKTTGSWELKQKFYSPSSQEGDRYGHSVAIYDSLIIVGAPFKDGAQPGGGRAYIYKITDTTIVSEIFIDNVNTSSSQDRFGFSVDIGVDRAIVGCPGDVQNGTESGSAVVVFRNAGIWYLDNELYHPTASPGDNFGYSVSMRRFNIAVGVPGYDSTFVDQGLVSTFRPAVGGGWVHFQDLYVSDLPGGARLGHDVNLGFPRIIAGAPGDDRNGINSGSAHIFRILGTWSLEKSLVPDDLETFDQYGFSVAIDSVSAMVSAPNKDLSGTKFNKVYAYTYPEFGPWEQEQVIQQPSPLKANFGHKVRMHGGNALVGALSDYPTCTITGEAHTYIQAPNGFWLIEPGGLESSVRQTQGGVKVRQDEGIRRE
jgi:hypothetical protein